MCRHTCVLAHLTCSKLLKLVCACTVAHDFVMHMRDSENTQPMRDARHELMLGLPHYICGVTTGRVAVDNEIQLYCS